MVTKCANPGCRNHFLYMNDGKVFRFEARCAPDGDASFGNRNEAARRIEFFWLCSNCAAGMTVIYDKSRGVAVQRLASRAYATAA